MKLRPSVSLIVESYNHLEGSGIDRLESSLRAGADLIAGFDGAELLLAEASGDPEVWDLVSHKFPAVQVVDAVGLDYDEAKLAAVERVSAPVVAFLDGDCLPTSREWLRLHVDRLEQGDVVGTGGFTRYEGGFLAAICTVMDFGYLLPRRERPMDSYVSNNAAFNREVLRVVPTPGGPMRCRSYTHAQLLLRRGTPVQMVPDALVEHELPPLLEERYRQGYDAVAVYWIDHDLRGRPLLRLGPIFALMLWARNMALDCLRAARFRRDLGLSRWQLAAGIVLFPLLRLVDLVGMLRATLLGPSRRLVPGAR